MIKTFAALLLLATTLPLCAQDTNPVQSWTSSDGKIIQAKFVKLEGDAVVIERDGKPFTIPFTKLASASVDLAKRLQKNAAGEGATNTQAEKKSDAATTTKKLKQIIVPRIDFSDTTVRVAVDFLHQRSLEQDTLETDPKRKGLEIVFSKSTAPDKIDSLRIRGLQIRNVPLGVALKYVCDQTKLHYIIEGSKVMLIPQAEYETEIHKRTLTVPPDFLMRLAAQSGGGAEKGPGKTIMQQLEAFGIAFPEGASATLSGNQLEVSNSRRGLDNIEQLVASLAAEAANDTTLQFRWLQTDSKTADAIVDLIKANNLSAAAFSAKIDPQVKGGKITEVTAFDRKIFSGERFVLRPANGNLALEIEAEAVVSEGGDLVNMICHSEWQPNNARGAVVFTSTISKILTTNHWGIISRWGDAKTDTLLLANVISNNTKTTPATVTAIQSNDKSANIYVKINAVNFDAELLETSADNLAKAQDAQPSNRDKAYTWLRERSKLLAKATISAGGQQEHLWSEKSLAELPSAPGVTIEWKADTMAGDPLQSTQVSRDAETGVAYIKEKLRRIVIPHISFNDTTVEEAIEFLRIRSIELDALELNPTRKGVNFVVGRPRTPTIPTTADSGPIRVRELHLRDVPLEVALKYICDQAKLRFRVDDYAVTIVPQTDSGENILSRTFKVPLGFYSAIDTGDGAKSIIALLKNAGITFGEGASAALSNDGVSRIANTSTELDKIEQLIQGVGYINNRQIQIRLKLNATYIPQNARKKSDVMEFLFESNELQEGVPEFVPTTAAAPQGKSVVVLVITPWHQKS